ncbi:MAG: UbiA family prenyltransferase [Acidobacteria bacterium]|nr:UbiA family prenyltransferase [Acidobacteriota bacterium]
MQRWDSVAYLIKVSRPGLWFQTLWMYLLPTSGLQVWQSWPFWLGFLYVTFPLNLLIYGWNDWVDAENDRFNPRKGSYVWGAEPNRAMRKALLLTLILSQVPFLIIFAILAGWSSLFFWAILLVSNGLYNHPRWGWRGKAPLELVNVLAFLSLLWLSEILNETEPLPILTPIYLALFCFKAHVLGELMDLEPDRRAGRHTTALWLGPQWGRLLVILLAWLEAGLLGWGMQEWVLASFLLAASGWLWFDLLVFSRKGPYRPLHFKLLAWGLNLSGYGSMLWVWWTRSMV